MQRILITGGNRGIGLGLVRQYLARGEWVFATARQPQAATELQNLRQQYPDTLSIVQLEVTDAVSITASVEAVRAQTDALDILINNAGINPDRPQQNFGKVKAEAMLHVLNVNAVAPLMVVQAYHDLLTAGTNPCLVNVSSQMGSLTRKTSGGEYSYCTSKAALNMVTRALAGDLRGAGVITITVHPGWVQTDMGGSHATLTPQESALGMLDLIDNLSAQDNGGFFNWNSQPHPW